MILTNSLTLKQIEREEEELMREQDQMYKDIQKRLKYLGSKAGVFVIETMTLNHLTTHEKWILNNFNFFFFKTKCRHCWWNFLLSFDENILQNRRRGLSPSRTWFNKVQHCSRSYESVSLLHRPWYVLYSPCCKIVYWHMLLPLNYAKFMQ